MEIIENPIVWAIIFIASFFLLRQLFLWYYRVNDIVSLLEQQNEYLKNIAGLKQEKKIQKNHNIWECPKCKTENPNTTFTCENCGYKIV